MIIQPFIRTNIKVVNIINNQWNSYSEIEIALDGGNARVYFGKGIDNSFKIDDIYLIELSSLGIDTLTVEQMDFYYELYDDLSNDIPHYTYTTYNVTKNEITLNDILAMISSVAIWYFVIKMIRGLLP